MISFCASNRLMNLMYQMILAYPGCREEDFDFFLPKKCFS